MQHENQWHQSLHWGVQCRYVRVHFNQKENGVPQGCWCVQELVGMHVQGTGWKSNEPNLIFNLLIIEHIVYINLQNVFKQHAMKIFVLFYFSRSSSFGIITFWLPHVYSVSLQMHFANHLSDMYARVSILRKCGLFQKKTEKTLRGSVYAFRIWSIRPWLQAQWRHRWQTITFSFGLKWSWSEAKHECCFHI